MKALLMHRDADFQLNAAAGRDAADLRQDLELDTLLDTMAAGDRFLHDVATAALLTPLRDCDAIRYRQNVLEDCLAHPDVVRTLYQLGVDALTAERRHWGFGHDYPETVLSRSLTVLAEFVVTLKQLRALADTHRPTFTSEGFDRLFAMLQDELPDEYFTLVERQLHQLAFNDGTLISARLGPGNKSAGYVLRLAPELTWRDRLTQLRRPAHSFDIHERDQASINALSTLKGRGITQAANAVAQSADHIKSFYAALITELAFYIAALNLHEHLDSLGVATCQPVPTTPGTARLSAQQLYELSLAINLKHHISGNDLDADAKQLVIVTGANQGGKSTFLRSLGQAQLMMQAGLFVAATSFTADIRDHIFTHYKREEDPNLESGKLDEELARMGEIARQLTPHSLLLCNESFAATNEREGSELARQITEALTANGVKVVFVTHLFDFADSIQHQQRQDVLFLRAPRGENGRRTYQLDPGGPLPTSYGEDTYREIFELR